ncbi:MAG: hypothetical protein WC378_15250 [Opitutaceae bacterium]|jgi:hypothetical protein
MSNSITNTQLVTAVSDSKQTFFQPKSTTGFVVGYGAFIDREYHVVTRIVGDLVYVRRGAWGTRATPHIAGSVVYVAPPNYFTQYDREGAGTAANEQVQPYINVVTGKIWSVVGGRWVEGNTYGSSTNYGLSPAIWADCPLEKLAVDPGYGIIDGDDFVGASPLVTAHKYVLAGANGTLTAAAAFGGGAVLTGPGTDNDEAYLIAGAGSLPFKLDAASTLWFEARVKLNQIATAQGVFVGFATEAGVDFMTDNTMAMKVVSAIGHQIIAATDIAAVWQSITQLTSGARAAINSALANGSTSYVKLGIKIVAGLATFYVDGVPDSTQVLSSASNYPLNALVAPVFGTKCGSAAANTLTIDWWKAAQTRIAN